MSKNRGELEGGRGTRRKGRGKKPADDGKHAARYEHMIGVAFGSLVEKQGGCRGGRGTGRKGRYQKPVDLGGLLAPKSIKIDAEI